MSNVIDLDRRRLLRELAARLDKFETRDRELRLQREPQLRVRVALARVCEFQERFDGLLKHVRQPLQEAIGWEIARQVEAGQAPDYRLALVIVCGLKGEYETDHVSDCREKIAAEYARLSSVYKDF